MRIGIGYDVHRLVEGRDLILGGVKIEYEKGLLGHSDADVLLHAVSDAVLGACALGDIGLLFPDNDPQFKGANSLKLLEICVDKAIEAGYKIGNIDSIIVAQSPKMRPYIDEIGIDQVSVKATTEERLGFTGDGSGISAKAIVLVE